MNEKELLMLNAYIDGELSGEMREAFESYLKKNERLQQEFISLKNTKAILGQIERIQVPQSFTLDPELYGRKRSGFLTNLIPANGFAPLAAAGSFALSMLLIFSGFLTFFWRGANMAGSTALEPQYDMVMEEQSMEENEEPMALAESPDEALEPSPALEQEPMESIEMPAEEIAEETASEDIHAEPAMESDMPAEGASGGGGLPVTSESEVPPTQTARNNVNFDDNDDGKPAVSTTDGELSFDTSSEETAGAAEPTAAPLRIDIRSLMGFFFILIGGFAFLLSILFFINRRKRS